MQNEFLQELSLQLARSNAETRKRWADRIVQGELQVEALLPLIHSGDKLAQRTMWLLGDVCDRAPELLISLMPLLYSLRNDMAFPGMTRMVAKWLWQTGVPVEFERESIPQLFQWMSSDDASIACKSFTAKCLVDLVDQKRLPAKKVADAIQGQCGHANRAFRTRMEKLGKQLGS